MSKTIAEVSKETLMIENYLRDIPDGQTVLFEVIQKETGVKMDERGKTYMRTALKRLKREYSSIIGSGIELACPENTISIVGHAVRKIDNSVKRGEKKTKNLSNQFYDDLSNEEKKALNFLSAMFGGIRAYSLSGKNLFKQKHLSTPNPVLPDNM